MKGKDGNKGVVSVIDREALFCDETKDYRSPYEPDAGDTCLLYTSPSPRDRQKSRMPSSA